MAISRKRALKAVEHGSEDVMETLSASIATLRSEIASIADAVNDYSGHRFSDLQHGASAFAREVQHQLPVVAKSVSRQASAATRAVRNDPLPTIVVLGTIALVSALVFRRD